MTNGILDSGQKIVTSGLLFDYDIAQLRSYPTTGTAITDLSGNSNNATLINGVAFNSGNGGNLLFDGVNDYVDCGTFTGLGSSNRTINVWFKIITLPATGTRRVIVLPKDDTNTDQVAFNIGYQTTLTSLACGFGGLPFNGYVSNISFALNTWINICGSINGNVITVYKDGVLVNSATNTGAVGVNPIVYLGRYNAFYGQYSNINIGITSIYNRALSATEVLQNFNANRLRYGL